MRQPIPLILLIRRQKKEHAAIRLINKIRRSLIKYADAQ
jgi:hypothetical protein